MFNRSLVNSILLVAQELHAIRDIALKSVCLKSAGLCTKTDLKETEEIIMSKISEYAARQNAFNDRIDVAIAAVTADIAVLNALIKTIQTSPGTLTPEDQTTLDAMEARGLATATTLEALDALTPAAPVVPVPVVPEPTY